MTSNETNNKPPSNDRYTSSGSQRIPTMFEGWALGISRALGLGSASTTIVKGSDTLSDSIKVNNNVNNNTELKEQQCKDILTDYTKCIQTIKSNENINKCRGVIELYEACVS